MKLREMCWKYCDLNLGEVMGSGEGTDERNTGSGVRRVCTHDTAVCHLVTVTTTLIHWKHSFPMHIPLILSNSGKKNSFSVPSL